MNSAIDRFVCSTRVAQFVLVAALLLTAGCVSVEKVQPGERLIGERLTLSLDGAWNRISAPGVGPGEHWTMEGLPVDQLVILSGLKDGEAVHPENRGASSKQKNFQFRSSMQAEDIAMLFEGALTRDGSRFRLTNLEPVSFGGIKGLKFEYALTRKVDNVQLSGIGYAAVSRGELFAIVYSAPRLAFFPRHVAKVEQITRSARIRE